MAYQGQAYIFTPGFYGSSGSSASNGSSYLRLTAIAGYSTTLTSTVSPLFSVQSIDLANYSYSPSFPTTATATLTGTFADGTTISKAFSFNNNNVLTVNDFTTETLTGFTNLKSFKIAATGYYLDVDNIVVTQGATPAADVPEPASLAIMGFGLAGVAVIRRRNNK